jgi:hypothetical protein
VHRDGLLHNARVWQIFAIREAHHEKSTWVVKERLEVALRRRFKVAEAEENEKECGMY